MKTKSPLLNTNNNTQASVSVNLNDFFNGGNNTANNAVANPVANPVNNASSVLMAKISSDPKLMQTYNTMKRIQQNSSIPVLQPTNKSTSARKSNAMSVSNAPSLTRQSSTMDTIQGALESGQLQPNFNNPDIMLNNSSTLDNEPHKYKRLDYYTKRDLEEESRNIRSRGQSMSQRDYARVKEINNLLAEDAKAIETENAAKKKESNNKVKSNLEPEAPNYFNQKATKRENLVANRNSEKQFVEDMKEKYGYSDEEIKTFLDDYKRTSNPNFKDWLVSREDYNALMQNPQMQKDIDALAMAYSNSQGNRGRGVRAIQAMGYKNSKEFAESLAEKYNLTKEQIDDIAKTYSSDVEKNYAQELYDFLYNFGNKKGVPNKVVGGFALPVLTKGMAGIEGYYNVLANEITGDERNQSHTMNALANGSQTGVADSINNDIARNIYNLGVGAASAVYNANGGGMGIFAQSGNVANDAMNEAIERGVDPRQAAMFGMVSGVSDFFFNKKGFNKIEDRLVTDIKDVMALPGKEIAKTVFKNLPKYGGIEAGENVAQDIVQYVADALMNGTDSELITQYANNMANNMSEEDAIYDVVKGVATKLLTSGAQGFATGALFGGLKDAKTAALGELAARVAKRQAERDEADALRILNEVEEQNPELITDNSVKAEMPENRTLEATKPEEITNDIVKNPEETAEIPRAEEILEAEAKIEEAPTTEEVKTEEPKAEKSQPRLPMNLQMFGELRSEKAKLEKQARSNNISAEEKANITEQIKDIDNQLVDLREKITDDVVNSGIMSEEELANDTNFDEVSKRISQFATNTAKKSGVVDDEMLKDPLIAEAAKVEQHSNEKTLAAAMNTVKNDGEGWLNRVIDGDYILGSPTTKKNGKVDYETADQDFDTCMILLRKLKQAMLNAPDDATKQALRAQYISLFAKTRQFSSNAARVLQAHKKWMGSAEGLEMAHAAEQSQRTKYWKDRNKNVVDTNNRLASAINKALNPNGKPKTEKVELSHDEIRQQVIDTLETKLPDTKITDTAVDYLTALVEDGKVPVWQIADELNYYKEHGEFYTIDESTKVTKKKSAKLQKALDTVFMPDKEGLPKVEEGYLKTLERVKNTLEDEYSSVKGIFNDFDYEVITEFLLDKVPTWKIRDEIEYRLQHGEWYTLGEDTPVHVETSKRLSKILDSAVGGKQLTKKKVKEPESIYNMMTKIRNTFEQEYGDLISRFNDDDFYFIANMFADKVPTWVIEDEIRHKLDHGEWYPIEDATPTKLQKNNKLIRLLDEATNGKTDKIEKTPLTDQERLERIRNVFEDYELALFGEGFDDNDYRFIDTLFQEKLPNWAIVDELRHKMETGEWYSLDEIKENIENVKRENATNQRVKNALNPNYGVRNEKPEIGFDELSRQIRNTFERTESVKDNIKDWTDEDYGYLATLYQQGATRAELADAINTRMATGSFGLSAETQGKIERIGRAMDNLNPESREYAKLQTEMFRLIATESSAKSDALEKFDSWRYLAMLGNPKTMVRNLMGNAIWQGVTGIKNTIGAVGEMSSDAISKATGHGGLEERTKTLYNPFSKKNRELLRLNVKDFNKSRYVSGAGDKYTDVKDGLKNARSAFDSDWAKLYEKLTKAGISDTWAVASKYATSLTGYMRANGLTEADLDVSYKYDQMRRDYRNGKLSKAEIAEMESLKSIYDKMEKGRDYALKEAEHATFHENNEVANALSRVASLNDVTKVIIDGIVPFKKTPLNILRSGLEYSPLGIAKSGALMIKRAYENKVGLPETYETFRGKKVNKTTANDVIDSWAKSVTGTALAAIGYLLYSKGVITLSNDDEKYQDQLEGLQNFSIKLNIDGKDRTYTLDWAAPSVMPLLMGAEVKKTMDDNAVSSKSLSYGDIINIINASLNPIVETSMLEGISDTMNEFARLVNDKNGDLKGVVGGTAAALGANMATNYVTQAIPTLFGQFARTLDGTRRSTDTISSDPLLSGLEKKGRKVMNKIPFLSKLNNPYVDARGEEQSNNPLEYEGSFSLENFGKGALNLGYQMLSPGYFDTVDTRKSDILSRNVYNGKGEDGKPIKNPDVFTDWKSQVKINGEKLSPDDMYKYRTASGKANTDAREALAKESWFLQAPAEIQTEVLRGLNNMADHVGKKAANNNYTSSNDYFTAYNKGGIPELMKTLGDDVAKKEQKLGLDKVGLPNNEVTKSLYDNNDTEGMQKYNEALDIAKEYGLDTITKEQYQTLAVKGEQAFREMMSYEQAAKENDVTNTQQFREAYSSGNVEQYKDAYNAITSTQVGEDDLGNPKYLEMNDTTEDIYEVLKQPGLDAYANIKKSMNGKDDTDFNYIGALEGQSNLGEAEKAFFFVLKKGDSLSKSAQKAASMGTTQQEQLEYAYRWYIIKNMANANHDGSFTANEKKNIKDITARVYGADFYNNVARYWTW